MKLIHKINNQEVREGDKVTDFQGETGIVLGWTKPDSPATTGRITVEQLSGEEHHCYPAVYFCEWINREDRLEDEQIALGVLKDPISIGDSTQAIYGFTQPTPVGGFVPSIPSVSSFDRTKELMAEVEEQFEQIRKTLNEIKALLS